MSDEGTLKTYMQVIGGKLLEGQKFKFAFLTVSDKCSSYCSKCYQNAGPEGKTRSVKESMNIIDSLQNQGFTVMPEMMELLPETTPLLKTYQYAGSKQISTSGELLIKDPTTFDTLKDYEINEIRISLDHSKVHQKWTKRKRERAKKAIKESVKRGFRVVMNYVVSKTTLPHLEEACQEGEELQVHQINFLNYIFQNRAKSMPYEVLDRKDLRKFHQEFTKLRKEYKQKNIILDRTGNFGPNPNPNSLSGELARKGMGCWAGKSNFGEEYFIDINNNIYPCMLLRDEEMIIGKLEHGKLNLKKDVTENWHRKTCYSLHKQLEKLY